MIFASWSYNSACRSLVIDQVTSLSMETKVHQLHIFFFPLMAPGHMIPMLDIARLFAAHDVKSTIITTPLNASFFSSIVDRERHSGCNISIQIIQFPSNEVGLTEGCESLHLLTSQEMLPKFTKATNMLQQPLEQLLVEYHPDYIVGDMFFPWLTDIAVKHGIPRLMFHGTCFFSLCAPHVVDSVVISSSETAENFTVVLDLPDKIEMKRSQVPNSQLLELTRQIRESELRSYGVLVNSFYELEPAYAEYYRKVLGKKAWSIGPVSLRNNIENAHKGQNANIDENYCLNWLNGKKPSTVLYVCFGSMTRFSSAQLLEIAAALEASGFPFIWVVKTSNEEQQECCLPEGFEERMEGKRGLIVKTLAPQVLILNHPAIGRFMTHCGWNSVLEGVIAGIPLITWPLFGDQFYNEQLVTKILRVGISVGVEMWSSWPGIVDSAVKRERIEKVVNQLMGSGVEAVEIRGRAKELGQKAKKAVEDEGSSYSNFNALLEELRACKQ